ncbi:TetR/AcrR family transcriptional regulator [Tardiphaga sp. vice304]|uniref:TetR/AcrR family transcriptional regulator n=1 Tax=Tardiphaga sp. vice304 TaxID=2592817 RepID=UPI0011636AA2|nr:TetR/AcrR family transcriptional regulator [Tardiphaga sp. vice304]QDM25942.1 TetR/AcrR family transcriptional regulator [Tardiphaga sp. vice304]
MTVLTKAKFVSPREKAVKKRLRLNPVDRERQILNGAIAYFAERGFDGPTRELTSRLGVSKGLLYRYFPGKEALIDRVYEEVFLGRWDADWDSLLADRSIKLRDRLQLFYGKYAETMLHDYEWVRIYLLSGLAGASINNRFSTFVTEHIYKPVLNELRYEFDAPAITRLPASEGEMELMWGLHGAIFYIGIRKWIYHAEVPKDAPGAVYLLVDGLYSNACKMMTAERNAKTRVVRRKS